jgi:hypothetical protein
VHLVGLYIDFEISNAIVAVLKFVIEKVGK